MFKLTFDIMHRNSYTLKPNYGRVQAANPEVQHKQKNHRASEHHKPRLVLALNSFQSCHSHSQHQKRTQCFLLSVLFYGIKRLLKETLQLCGLYLRSKISLYVACFRDKVNLQSATKSVETRDQFIFIYKSLSSAYF